MTRDQREWLLVVCVGVSVAVLAFAWPLFISYVAWRFFA